MTREDLIDASVYSTVNLYPALTTKGLQYFWRGFTVIEVRKSLERLAALQLVRPDAAGAADRLDVQWSVVRAS